MTPTDPVRVAVVQAEPVWLDLDATTAKTVDLVAQAAAQGARLVAFPETWIPGYPMFLWVGAVAWQVPFVVRYRANSLELGSAQHRRIAEAARTHDITVVLGYSERAGGSLYMGQMVIDGNGETTLVRRKLKPTHVERSLFGEGDGSDLSVLDTSLGRVGALCCWEHLQPLTKYAMYSMDEQIHVAAWPCFGLYDGIAYALGAQANLAASQTYALEGGCFVLAATQTISREGIELFAQTPEQAALIAPGGGASRIFGPDGSPLGNVLAPDEEGLVVADLDFTLISIAKNAADPAGHYARPDVTRLLLNRGKGDRVVAVDGRAITEVAGSVAGPSVSVVDADA